MPAGRKPPRGVVGTPWKQGLFPQGRRPSAGRIVAYRRSVLTGPPAHPAPSPHQNVDFELLVDAVTDYAICMLDGHGRIISWNTGAEHISGWMRDDILGRHFSIFYPPLEIVGGTAV